MKTNINNRTMSILFLVFGSLIITPFLMNSVWIKNEVNDISFFLDISGQPLVLYFVLPFTILFETLILCSNLTDSYVSYLLIRWGKLNKMLTHYYIRIFGFALIDGLIFLLASLVAGFVKNYNIDSSLADIILLLGRLGQLILFILTYAFWILLIQLTFKKGAVTFIGSLGYWGMLIFSFRSNLTLIRKYPLIPGQDLNWGSYLSAQIPTLIPFISLGWLVIELILIRLVGEKKY